MRASALALALLLGGCNFTAYPNDQPAVPDAGPGVDGAIDTGPVGTGEPVCIGKYIRVCIAAPSQTLTLNARKIDTATDTLCLPYTATPAVDACVIAGQSITIPANNTVTVTGAKRLILLSTSSITIAGVLDASSNRNSPGPAADTAACLTNFTPPQSKSQGGGGWGGALGGGGSNGGTSAGGAIGGIAAAQGNVLAFHGGCPGGAGGNGELISGVGLGGAGGEPGRGGGAVLLIAQQALSISGTVTASGGGGSGGHTMIAAGGGGGGGGGSGGMIVLDAGSVSVPGKCFANGGGGGEGASAFSGRDGRESSGPDSVARGGDQGGGFGGGPGGDGGFGATPSTPGRAGQNADLQKGGPGGGGGGGGGVGVVKVFSTDPPQNTSDLRKVSPAPSYGS